MRKYKYKTQVHLVCATMTIHNFIRRNSRKDIHFKAVEDGSPPDEDNGHEVQERSSANVTVSSPQMNYLRDAIGDKIVENLWSNNLCNFVEQICRYIYIDKISNLYAF